MRSCLFPTEQTMEIKIIRLDETDSTNRFLHDYVPEEGEDIVVAVAGHQTAGRGQGNNSWESEPGKNLLFSILAHPTYVIPSRQFIISMATALALRDVLTQEAGKGISIKWPNDIYWHDKKISGTLIETAVCRQGIKRCIIGIGININQEVFHSDAPNPVSLRNITGHDTERESILQAIINRFCFYMGMVERGESAAIISLYHKALYRKEGFHAYCDSNGMFDAEIKDIEENGRLLLRDRNGRLRGYFFKEVKFIINNKQT